jgi:predicted outer membrane protein
VEAVEFGGTRGRRDVLWEGMKPSKSLLFSASVLTGALCIGIAPVFAQSSHTPADPARAQNSTGKNALPTASEVQSGTTTTPKQGKLGFSDRRFVTKTAEGGQLEIAIANLASQKATSPEVRNFAQQLVTDHTAMSMQLWKIAAAKGLSADLAQYSTREGAIAMSSGRTPSVAPDPLTTPPTPITSDVDNKGATTGSKATRDLASADAVDRSRANPDTGIAGAPTGDDIPAASKDWNDPTKDRTYKRLNDKTGAEFDQAFITAMVSDHEKDVKEFEKRAKDSDDTDVKEFAATNLTKLREHLEKARSLSARVMSP